MVMFWTQNHVDCGIVCFLSCEIGEVTSSVSDPYSLNPDQDPGILLNPDRVQLDAEYGSHPDPDPGQDFL
jgi:hypothetical protein